MDKKKIGIITRRDGYNIGTSLQAVAMQKIVTSICTSNEVIDYCEYSWKARIRYLILDILGICFMIFPNSKLRKGYLQRQRFRLFDNILVKTKKRYYYSVSRKINSIFDIFICGSDQIWNPKQITKAFLLNFVSTQHRKIAYAPSVGLNCSLTDFSEESIKLIKEFDNLSCRETSGAKCIANMTGKKCELVLDPTLLIPDEKWKQLAKPIIIPKKYVLCYFLGNSYPIKFVQKLSSDRNLAVINIKMFYYDYKTIGNDLYASPDEFLYLIENADIVCTNSYHGTLFSILYNKQFYLFQRSHALSNYNENSRFETLFSLLKLQIAPLSIEDTPTIPKCNIDYALIKQELDKNRLISINYLKQSIYNGKN